MHYYKYVMTATYYIKSIHTNRFNMRMKICHIEFHYASRYLASGASSAMLCSMIPVNPQKLSLTVSDGPGRGGMSSLVMCILCHGVLVVVCGGGLSSAPLLLSSLSNCSGTGLTSRVAIMRKRITYRQLNMRGEHRWAMLR